MKTIRTIQPTSQVSVTYADLLAQRRVYARSSPHAMIGVTYRSGAEVRYSRGEFRGSGASGGRIVDRQSGGMDAVARGRLLVLAAAVMWSLSGILTKGLA